MVAISTQMDIFIARRQWDQSGRFLRHFSNSTSLPPSPSVYLSLSLLREAPSPSPRLPLLVRPCVSLHPLFSIFLTRSSVYLLYACEDKSAFPLVV
ncbi:hypothetical protein RJT34_16532 [Clitoria ternatea]|uniref:Uncharacterized protein n=1 Tax=Clitoria ternatea TaxID=43366 RepID=A0AAN9PCB8_CLITE